MDLRNIISNCTYITSGTIDSMKPKHNNIKYILLIVVRILRIVILWIISKLVVVSSSDVTMYVCCGGDI